MARQYRHLLSLIAMLALASVGEASEVRLVAADAIAGNGGVLEGIAVVASGQPDEKALKNVAEAGFVAVIDLRTGEEDRGLDEPGTVESLGMEYVLMPIGSAEEINFDNASRLDKLLAGFDGPVLLHCGSGNRVGALVALREYQNGASADQAIAAGKTAGLTRLEPVVREKLQTK